MKVTVVGAGAVGASCAEYIAIKNFAAEVVLLDIKEGYAEGKAMDLMQTASLNGFDTKITGSTSDYSKTANSDVVVITSGIPRKPGMTREELIGINAGIVQDVDITENFGSAEHRQDIYICVFYVFYDPTSFTNGIRTSSCRVLVRQPSGRRPSIRRRAPTIRRGSSQRGKMMGQPPRNPPPRNPPPRKPHLHLQSQLQPQRNLHGLPRRTIV